MLDKKYLPGVVSLAVLFLAIYYSLYSLVPHVVSGSDVEGKNKFSTINAMQHIKNMTSQYHFVGTPYHETVKNYVISELEKLGLETEIQKQFALNSKWKGATVNENILARIKGQKEGKALMLLSHYDSAPFASKGASDDAVGVATILEGVRVFIESKVKPVHDIIILISDGEEIGLVGAKAFVEHHRWVKDVGMVINFEARGSGGPSYTLLETNGGNAKMLKEFINANPKYPIANSFLYSVYKMLPNDTDLTMFREIGDIDGYNFAFIDDFYNYHSVTDDFEHVDINTVEHQGDYLMSLLNYFSKKDFGSLKSDQDLVFFNFPILGVIAYPFAFAIPIFLLLLIGFFILLIVGVRKNILKIKNILIGLGILIFALVFGLLLTIFGWKFINILHPEYQDILQGFPYNGHYYIAGFMIIITTFMLYLYDKLGSDINLAELLVAPILFWFIINAIFVFKLVGAAFLIIPIVFILMIFAFELFFKSKLKSKIILYSFLLVPGLIIVTPFIDMFPVGLRMVSLPVSSIFTVLLVSLLFPVLKSINFKRELLILFAVLSLVTIGLAEMKSGFDSTNPKPNSLNYVFNIDEGKAYWETYNQVLDDWLIGVMGESMKKGGALGIGVDSKYHTNVTYHSEAKIIDIPKPQIDIIKDSIIGNIRNVELIIKPNRKINRIDIVTLEDIKFNTLSVNDADYRTTALDFKEQNNGILTYYFTQENEIIKLNLSFDKKVSPKLKLFEMSYDLIGNKELNVPNRPKGYCSMPFIPSDAVIDVMDIKL